ncbi:MAG: hypothetical protein J6Z31_10350 [Fibrobacter sp.]|nr:hypothetical protein [Fibrobacter sp.]
MKNLLRISLLLTIFLVASASALDRIWDARYTFGPEFMVRDRTSIGAGFYTNYQEDGYLPMNAQLAINDYWEIGAKLLFDSEDNLESIQSYVDVGGKYRILEYSTIGADFLIGVGNKRGAGLVFSYTSLHPMSRIFSTLYEARLGFFDRIVSDDGLAEFALGVTPRFKFTPALIAMIGIESSGSFGDLLDDFMVDIVPRVQIGILPYFHVMGELSIGILQEKNNDRMRLGVYGILEF